MLTLNPRSLPGLLIAIIFLVSAILTPRVSQASQTGQYPAGGGIAGPFVDPPEAYPHSPAVLDGDLRMAADELQPKAPPVELDPLRYIPGESPKPFAPQLESWLDPVAQTGSGPGAMPAPLDGFAGLNLQQDGAGWPPDTNGDVGPNHYIQTVNTSIAIFDLSTGLPVVRQTLDAFFIGPANTPCDTSNRGDPIVLYDPYVDRWIVSDFAWPDNQAAFYQCIAVSQTSNPVSGGWYYYALRADTGDFEHYLNDYPKLGVWHDGWYMTANMFDMVGGNGFGVRVWALDRQVMIQGQPLREVHFDLCQSGDCASLLPAHDNLAQGGALQPPNYLLAARLPAELLLWRFDANFANPALSTLSAPVAIPVAPLAITSSVPQLDTYQLLDSLSYRLMMQLQYRIHQGVESLWVNHTVASSGVAALRWYQIQQPASPAPLLAQQSTYQPEGAPESLHRWMGSLAVDREDNMAIGYSASAENAYPSIRIAGRMAPETPSRLPQAELEVKAGLGAQLFTHRWGDYSAMSVAPDGCTFYYTSQYYLETGTNWQTWIVPFRFPSCGQPKGVLQGSLRNADTGQPLAGVQVVAAGAIQTFSLETDAFGLFSLSLAVGTYTLSAGPWLPGYPVPSQVAGVVIGEGDITVQDLTLTPFPSLVLSKFSLDDPVPWGNANHIPEPGEVSLELGVDLLNDGAAIAKSVEGVLSSPTLGVTLLDSHAFFPDIAPGQSEPSSSAYRFSVDASTPCGTALEFQQVVKDSLQIYTQTLSLDSAMLQPSQFLFTNDVEQGSLLWQTQGFFNTWEMVNLADAPSPSQVWTDSPFDGYKNYTNASLVIPAYNLSGKRRVQVSFATRYSLEPGWDYLYLEYSLDGGQTWQPDALAAFTGFQSNWSVLTLDASALDGQPNAALRFRLESDVSLYYDGVYLDDISLLFQPYDCEFPVALAPTPPVPLAPMAGELFHPFLPTSVTFTWLPGPSGAPVDGYRFYLDGVQVAVLPGVQTQTALLIQPGEHYWAVQAYNAWGESPQSAPTHFWFPFIYYYLTLRKIA